MTSSNYALVDYDKTTGIPIDDAIRDQVTLALFERMKADAKEQGKNIDISKNRIGNGPEILLIPCIFSN